jgi:Family of unknown function (DUF6338)
MYNFQAIQILIFLIPGFVSETLLNKFVVRKEKSELMSVIEALIFSMIIYVIYALAVSKSPVTLTVINTPSTSTSSTYTYNPGSFLWLFGFSVIIPLVLSFLMTHDVYMNLLRTLQVTRRTARDNVWMDVFLDKQRYITINFTDGRRIRGWPKYYSDDQDKQYIYLMKPELITQNGTTKQTEIKELNIDGILITPEQKIESIEFYKAESEYNKK